MANTSSRRGAEDPRVTRVTQVLAVADTSTGESGVWTRCTLRFGRTRLRTERAFRTSGDVSRRRRQSSYDPFNPFRQPVVFRLCKARLSRLMSSSKESNANAQNRLRVLTCIFYFPDMIRRPFRRRAFERTIEKRPRLNWQVAR